MLGDLARFGPFELDLQTHELRKHGTRVKLQEQPFQILTALIVADGELVTISELRQRLWPEGIHVDFQQGILRAINKLRTALGDSAAKPIYVETVNRSGYRFLAPVSWLNDTGSMAANVRGGQPTSTVNPPRHLRLRGQVTKFLHPAITLALVSALVIAAIISVRRIGRHPAQPVSTAWVLIATSGNGAGDAASNESSDSILQREFRGSISAMVVPPERIQESLALMRRQATVTLNYDLAREVCLRDGDIQLMVLAHTEKLDTQYVLTSELVNPQTGVTLRSITDKAEEKSQFLTAVRRLAERTNRAINDELPHITATGKTLEKVTTSSLHALELYSSANELLVENHGISSPAVDLLKEAVEIDPEFLSAEALLTRSLGNLRREPESRPYLHRMFEGASAVPDRERYFILGTYYEALHQPEKAAEQYEALVRLYPDHFWGVNVLAELYRNDLQRPNMAIPYVIRRAELRPADFIYNYQAWQLLTDLRKQPEIAERYRVLAEKLATTPVIERFPYAAIDLLMAPANQYVIEAKPSEALKEIQRLGQLWEAFGPKGRSALANREAFVYAALGRPESAKAWFSRAGEGMGHDYAGCNIADAEGDNRALLHYLYRTVADGDRNVQGAVYFARLRQVAEAQRIFRELQARPGLSSAEKHWVRGELARAQGNFHQARPELQAAVDALTVTDDGRLRALLPAASEGLADLLQNHGDERGAIAVLEPLESFKLDNYGQFPEFARVLVKLSSLYRQNHRFQDAQKVDTQLRTRFAAAEPAYFVIRYLQGASAPAARGPQLASLN